jgi:formate dehydrogenase subunit gamma
VHHTEPALSTTETSVIVTVTVSYATYALAVLVVAHVIIAIGILPGYRGVWRAMHLGGRTPASAMRRVWPASASTSEDEHAAQDTRPRVRV